MSTTPATKTLDDAGFERLMAPYRRELQAHCYRMLGSSADAEDALQESLLRAWRGLPGFEGRSSLRSWLYRIATNVCLKVIERRRTRVLPVDYGPSGDPQAAPEAPPAESVWIDPYPDETLGVADGLASPDARYEQPDSVELAFIPAFQHLPPRQRAVLLLRDVLGFAPSEIVDILETTPASVYSALQRAREAVDQRVPALSQQATLRTIGNEKLRRVVERYVRAWEAGDVQAVTPMLASHAPHPDLVPWARGDRRLPLRRPAGPRPRQDRGRLRGAVALRAGTRQRPDRLRDLRVEGGRQPIRRPRGPASEPERGRRGH